MTYNTGKSLDTNLITDIKTAIKDFSEGNLYLEKLLLDCYKNNFKTVACCSGHEEKKQRPYISFLYSKENEQFIYYIVNALKDHNIDFRYFCSFQINSFFQLNFTTFEQNCFDVVTEAIKGFDKSRDYYFELPLDLQNYFDIIKNVNDSNLFTDVNDVFQFSYFKENDLYTYVALLHNFDLTYLLKESGFVNRGQSGLYNNYYIESKEREGNNNQLEKMAINLTKRLKKLYVPKDVSKKSLDELNISFEYQDNDRSKNLLKCEYWDTADSIAIKLAICSYKGINAYTTFNGVLMNNYKTYDPNEIKERYIEQFYSNGFKR